MRLYPFLSLLYICLLTSCGPKSKAPDAKTPDSTAGAPVVTKAVEQKKQTADEDSIRRDHGLSDPITLIKKIYIEGQAQYAFILHGEGVEQHQRLWDLFTMRDGQQQEYTSDYNRLREKFVDIAPHAIHSHPEMIDGWLPVFWYQKHPYVVRSCDMYLVHQVTDSTFMTYYMDGMGTELIKSIDQNKDGLEVNTNDRTYSFVLKDPAKSIYLLTGNGEKTYVVPFRKAGGLPIIIESCTMDGVDLVDYEKTPPVNK
ncbi:hypothetical protein SAMN04488109_5496 [Chryseolinea serpens]|uniref:Uncharacterized protein n=1 Tax=Chryseolinea serpens TaxID=947013 RepID=A0A1M5VXG5_9BACT|nr:hypothetical protein [Chryseolinea serpens]SHH79891.1 hypothetical protein SAMN04488109_5496 [Chryseolinea serpens]